VGPKKMTVKGGQEETRISMIVMSKLPQLTSYLHRQTKGGLNQVENQSRKKRRRKGQGDRSQMPLRKIKGDVKRKFITGKNRKKK